ncbi:sodium-dependent glucose transporter 1A-like [Glandiceps talaboti]
MIWEKRSLRGSLEDNINGTRSPGLQLLLDKDLEASDEHKRKEAERCKTLYDRKVKTILLYLAYFGLGACVSIVGPSLMDLQLQLRTSLETTTFIFTARSTGHLFGSVVGGACLDRIENHLVLALSLFGAGICGLFVAWCDYFYFIVIVIAAWGFFTGSLETGVNVVCVDSWGKDSGPWIQGLHLFFSLGCTTAPLIAAPFLTPPPPVAMNITSNLSTTSIITTPSTSQFERTLALQPDSKESQQLLPLSENRLNELISLQQQRLESMQNVPKESRKRRLSGTLSVNDTNVGSAYAGDIYTSAPAAADVTSNSWTAEFDISTTVHYNETMKSQGRLWIPYTIIALFEITLAAPFFCMFVRGSFRIVLPKGKTYGAAKKARTRKKFAISRIILVILLFFFSFSCIGVEIVYGGFIYTFAMTSDLVFSVQLAGYLNSAFWGSYAVSLAVGICCALALTPRTMLIIDLAGLCTAGALLAVFGDDSMAMLWGTTVLLGVSLAKVFPTGIFWTETYIKLTGKAVATFITASSASEMILPWLCGTMITSHGNMMLMYITLALSLSTTLVFIFMQITASFHGERTRKSDDDEEDVDGDDEREVEEKIKIIHLETTL